DQIVTDLGFKEYTAAHGSTFNMVLFTLSLMIGTAGLPHVIMRFFTVPKVSDARWSAGWTLVFIALLYLTAPAVGAMARLNISELMWPNGTAGEAVTIQQIDNAPEYAWMATWKKTGLLDWEDKNGDGKIQYYNDANAELQAKAEEKGWKGNELTKFNRDILVLANPEIASLPGWVIGLVAAGGLAAALSTAAGLLLAISSAISHDLLKGQLTPNMSERSELLAARLSMAAAIVVAVLLGLNPPGFAAQTVALAFGLAAASIFPALMMGIFSTRINNTGAVAGMLAGLVVTLLYIFLHKGWFFIPDTNSFSDADPLLGPIKSTSFGAIGAAVNFAVAYLVTSMTKEIPQEIRELVESVRVPRGAGAAAAGH
ncbi:MAG: VC_2705 family sodium/solute symporter, partial [Pseudomonadota bacterium]